MRSALPLVWLAACPAPQPAPPPVPTGIETITAEALRSDVVELSDDSFNGREAGTSDAARAAEFLIARFTDLGLKPLPGDDDLLSEVPLFKTGFDADQTTLTVRVDGESVPVEVGRTCRPFPFSDAGTAEAPVVFAGYGITAPDLGWDDYQDLDVKGKIVLILRHEPGEKDEDSPFDGVRSSEHASFRSKAMNAAEHGAIGYLLVTDPLHHEGGDDLRLGGRLRLKPPEQGAGGQSEGPEFRAAQIARPVAEAMVASTGKDLTAVQTALEAGTRPADLPLGQVEATLSVVRAEGAIPVAEHNVVAFLEGETRPDEWVVVGAHYDHVGGFVGEGDTVFNGADDNASGTAGMLALAKAFSTAGDRPDRSMVFMGFTAEEKGLLGSKAWVERNGVDKVVFMLNLDMIGRNSDKELDIIGDGFGTGVTELVASAVSKSGLERAEPAGVDYFGASDHDPFYKSGVPFLFFFTGTHEDYHQVGDHAEKVDYERMNAIVRTAYHLLEPVVEGEATPSFVHHIGWLGAQVDGQTLLNLEADGRAAKAGLVEGDRVIRVGEPADETPSVGESLFKVEPGSTVMVTVERDGGPVEVEVMRAKVGYLGIFPGSITDELKGKLGLVDGTGVFVRGVSDGGPAATAGLREGDVILQLGGTPVSQTRLGRVLQRIGAGETVPALIVRGGERQTLSLVLGERPG